MNDKATPVILDIDSLLDMDMGGVETLPDYVTPGNGLYRLKITEAGIKSRKGKDGKDQNNLTIVYSILETTENESNEPPFPDGSLFQDRFQATEEGLQYFKKQAMKILNVTDMAGVALRDIFEGLQGTEFDARVTQRKSSVVKDGVATEYTNINVRPVH